MRLYTDINEHCCAVLRARVNDGDLPPGDVVCADIAALVGGKRMRAWLRRYSHVHFFAGIGGSALGLAWAGWPDDRSIVTGGFPCQDISSAGKGAGLDGARSGLYREMLRGIRLIRPDGAFGENVGALAARGLDRLAREMGAMGYRPHCFRMGAWAVGAPHERERWWILANRAGERCQPWPGVARNEESTRRRGHQSTAGDQGGGVADAQSVGRDERESGPRRRSKGRVAAGRPDQGGALADVRGAGQGTERVGEARAFPNVAGAGEPVGDTQLARCEGHRANAGQPQKPESWHAGQRSAEPGRWPHPLLTNDKGHPLPTPQYDWEPPRNFEGTGMISAQWRLALMGYPLHWLDLPAKVAARFGTGKKLNRLGIEATGNAQVPQCVAVLARAWLHAHEVMAREECAA